LERISLKRTSIVAHRGASAHEPENTLRSIRTALNSAVEFVEVDARESSDGYVVLIHDETVDRTTDGRGCVKEMTLKELRGLDAGLGERIPTLQEAIDEVRGRANLVVEVKEPGVVEEVVRIFEENRVEGDFVASSFYHRAVERVKMLNPKIRTGVIFSSQPIKPKDLALEAEAEILLPRWVYVDSSMVGEAHEEGLLVFPWTVDDLETMRRLAEMGVDGIVTNRPDMATKI
jgi:glycerophosphoryl diester phosphodiesterase